MTHDVDDPYAVLGVSRDATDEELRRAYEQNLARAAAVGAFRTVQKIDAAFSLLRDPYSRAIFDREGRIVDLPRLIPDQRWSPPASVPFPRSSPSPASARRGGAQTWERARNVLVAVLVAAVVGAALKFGLLQHTGGQTLSSDIWLTSPTAATSFPVHHSAHRKRLLPVVQAPGASGPHAFEMTAGGAPVRRDPCSPIQYVISGNEPFRGAGEMLTSAINEVSADSGLQFVYSGTSTEQPSEHRAAYQPVRYGKQWAPVLIAWTDAQVVPRLEGKVAGLGGGVKVTLEGQPRLVSGIVALDGPDLATGVLRPNGPIEARAIILHELGHLVGLAHVSDPTQIMNPTTMPLAHYASGDRQGLAVLGAGPCPTNF